MTDALRVIIVDDRSGSARTIAEFLQQGADAITATTETDARGALRRVYEEPFACVVSDYDMSGMNGLEFLDAVREVDEDLPFILFTGSGSESLASDALSRGVTDYIQKTGRAEQLRVLANRIEKAVSSYRTQQTLARERERYQTFLEQSTDLIATVDATGQFQYVSEAWRRIMGYEPDDLLGENAFELMHSADAPDVWTEFKEAVNNPEETRTAEFRFEHADGSWRWLEAVGNNQLDNPLIEGFIVNVRDITERQQRQEKLRRQNERLEQFASVVSHDLRNPMNILSGRLELARETGDEKHLDAAQDALDRMDTMIDDILELAREGRTIDDEPVDLESLSERCRESVDSDEFDLTVETEMRISADRGRLRRVFENLFRNAAEHAGPDVSVAVGALEHDSGFYVADDGPGIPAEERDAVLETGYTTADDGTGLGLAIVTSIVDAHGWSISVTESVSGGTRFEVADVESASTPCEAH